MTGFDDWKSLLVNFLSEDEGEVRLKLARDETSIVLSTDKEKKSIELVPKKDGDIEIYVEGELKGELFKEEVLEGISKKLESEFDYKVSSEEAKIRNKSMFAIPLMVKASLGSRSRAKVKA